MKIKGIIDEDCVNYKKISMFIITSTCSFKCDIEAECQVCQNSDLANATIVDYPDEAIVERYLNNPISEAITFGGLEPFDQFEELYNLIKLFRQKTQDDIVIYTGYYPIEINLQLKYLSKWSNIIIKFGRFIPNKPSIYDNILGVNLASDNQHAMRLEDALYDDK